MDNSGGGGSDGKSDTGDSCSAQKDSIPAGLVEWSPGGFGSSSTKKSRVSSQRQGAGLNKNQHSSDSGNDGSEDDDVDAIAATEGSGSRLSLREKQRRQIDRCLRRVFEHASQQASRNHDGSTSAPSALSGATTATAAASSNETVHDNLCGEAHEESAAQNDEALRQYVSIVLDLLPRDESFTPVTTTTTSSVNNGANDNSSDSSSDGPGDVNSNSSSSSSSLGTELLLPGALAPAIKSPYGVLKAQPSLLVHAGAFLLPFLR